VTAEAGMRLCRPWKPYTERVYALLASETCDKSARWSSWQMTPRWKTRLWLPHGCRPRAVSCSNRTLCVLHLAHGSQQTVIYNHRVHSLSYLFTYSTTRPVNFNMFIPWNQMRWTCVPHHACTHQPGQHLFNSWQWATGRQPNDGNFCLHTGWSVTNLWPDVARIH
jgi:hypothetical protein